MTSKIDTAIATVIKGVKRLAKDERNSHGGYSFAGIDDFLAMTGKLCGEAGLSVIMDEDEFEVVPEFFATKQGKVAGLRMRFAIVLRCDGEQAGPYRRSIMVPANMGSQAFGAAQSYVLKQFLRATFQIPTGDKGEDIDAHDTGAMQPDPISDDQRDQLMTLASQSGADMKAFCTYYQIGSLRDLPAIRFTHAKTMLEKKLSEKAQPEREAA